MFMTLYDPYAAAGTDELDVRQVPKSQRHPMIFARFDALAAGESFVLVNSHDPIHLREEFARDRPGAYDWRYLESSQSDELWRTNDENHSDSIQLAVVGSADADHVAGLVWPDYHPVLGDANRSVLLVRH